MALFSKLKFYGRALKLIFMGKWAGQKELQTGYDFASKTYDDLWGEKTLPHDCYLIDKLNLKGNERVLDLACGTGLVSLEIARRLSSGHVLGLDLSGEMLKRAQEKARHQKLNNVTFAQADMLAKIKEFSAEGFDVATCCWAIGYSEPIALLRQMRRVVKPNGKIGIIANINNSPQEAYDIFMQILEKHPEGVATIVRLKFPQSKEELRKMFSLAGLEVLELWENSVVKICTSGKEVLDWLLKTGAGAVFADTLLESFRDKLFAEFALEVEKLKSAQGIKITHRFVAGIAKRA